MAPRSGANADGWSLPMRISARQPPFARAACRCRRERPPTTLGRIDGLIDALEPAVLVILGDFLHAREAHAPGTLAALAAWRERRAKLDIVLVEGNHDRYCRVVRHLT